MGESRYAKIGGRNSLFGSLPYRSAGKLAWKREKETNDFGQTEGPKNDFNARLVEGQKGKSLARKGGWNFQPIG